MPLYSYRARYYDPTVGRFVSEDPVRWAGGLNLYRYVKNQPATLTDPSGEAPVLTPETKCLICTVYGEARGQNAACQYGVASVILNRLAQQRAKGRTSSICGIVSAAKQFDAYGGGNYNDCMTCSISPKDRKDYDDTVSNFSQAFDMLSDALYFSNNTPGLTKYWENKKNKSHINFPTCPKLAFYTD